MSDKSKVKPWFSDRWGWWVKITDRDSADHAIKMSGLPVFLWGTSWFFVGLLTLLMVMMAGDVPGSLWAISAALLIAGITLIVLGLLLRQNRNKLAPWVAGVYIAGTIINSIGVLMAPSEIFAISLASLFMSGLFILLSVGGLRGWSWLKANGAL